MQGSAKCTGSAAVVDLLIGRRRFLPTWWAVALTAAGVSLFVALGMWQLERADFKEAIELKFEQRLALTYQAFSPGDELGDDLVDIEFRKLLLQGHYDNARSLLVDNQLHRAGQVTTLLRPCNFATVITWSWSIAAGLRGVSRAMNWRRFRIR
ncbi:MAG: hypothetical protein GY785_01915 [Gammaproteobacteria bacterium]|nr:hypothetical protein [Gammaproteobacteria bacterium]